jgi:class 3 adenylate cyclase/tetratricopeptide (TPR) repeat protein
VDLATWLSSLGLGQYARTLAENDIDLEIIREVVDDDLEKLGVSLGHRRKLRRAIAELDKSTDAKQEAERRQVTVMFCDLVGSTELAAMLDPEDMGAVIQRFQNACAGAIARFDGFVARFMGDGVLAYFGYPQANEDSAEHAVRAALALIIEIAQIPRAGGDRLRGRVGIATGTVMIGDVAASASGSEFDVVGDTPNLAARLQALASPGTVLVASGTRQLLGQRFHFEDAGEHQLKGFPAPMRAWRVAGETLADSRFAATRGKSSQFVGREAELANLLEQWRLASEGHGRAVVVTGEAGMGKSRLVEALIDEASKGSRRVVKCQCSPYHVNSALHPVLRNIERAAAFDAGDADDQRREKLDSFLSTIAPDVLDAPALIAEQLGLPAKPGAAPDMPPMQRKPATLTALTRVILSLSTNAPVLLVLEDAHWSDPTTRELWTRKIEAIADSRVLLVVTARPEFLSPWKRGNVTEINLSRLSDEQCVRLVEQVAGPQQLAPELVREIASKSGGIPLYVEELAKAVSEAVTDHVAVPATLHDSLMARLDRVGSAKALAQVAAVIGEQFTRSLLASVTLLASSRLDGELNRLVEAGLIAKMNRTVEPAFTFSHALLRDLAYENLLRTRRQQLHERIARAMVEEFPAIAAHEPEVLAHHYARAGRFDQACDWRERAGDQAAKRSSFAEAYAHYEAAAENASRLSDSGTCVRRELAVLLKAGPALIVLRGPQHPSVSELYDRARALAAELGDEDALFQATWGLWFNANIGRRLESAARHADDLFTVASRLAREDLILEGLHCGWSTAFFRGEVAKTLEQSELGKQRYDREKHAWLGPVFGGHDPGVCAFACHSVALALQGRPGESRQCCDQAVKLAEALNNPNSICHSLQNGMFQAQLLGDEERLGAMSQRLLEIAERYNLPPQRAHARLLGAWLRARRSEVGAADMIGELSTAMSMGPMYRYYAALVADICERAGMYDEALRTLEPALASVTEHGVGVFVSELHRLRGLCLAHRDAKDPEARRALGTALEVARTQGATLLERRAAQSLAALN